ncbi:outer membrane lipid asymmetry maintenance protein MlaD [Candidatus Tisiphia endosymbiont of Beris chalybata]|uniref:outer membrane lipid asymmetry maintenance protein MlaD n=1 Tax=Candidatus Tisiphia endosymbiont of Beris chalybata TaxID=3066262 RepID=UPI00312C963B
MKQHFIETVVGFTVIIIALMFFSFAYRIGSFSKAEKGYNLTASFQNAEGIITGSDVMLAGVKIGSVTNITLDKISFFALLTINIKNEIKLPKDTSLAIVTSGLLGGKYIAVTPGLSDETLASNEQIKYTQSSVSIEAIIGKLIYSFGGSSK